jgi:hypothetical protein
MLTLICMESTDRMSGGNTFHLLQHVLLWAGIHLSVPHLHLLNLVMRKSGHMLGYGLLCFCWMLLLRGSCWLQHEYKPARRGRLQVWKMWWRAEWAVLAVFLTFCVASADELHQMSIPSRSGSWWDVTLDTSAGLIMLALVWAKARWLCRNQPA